MRVFDGSVRKGSRILLMVSGKAYEVLRVGVFSPRLQETDSLGPGDVGFIMAGIKEVHETKIGDTKKLQSACAALDEATKPLADLLMDKAMEAMLKKRGLIR